MDMPVSEGKGVETPQAPGARPLALRVRDALFWRSGTQILAQLIMWASTFLVIRMLNPADYGLFAMAQVLLTFLGLWNGYGVASALIQRAELDDHTVRQAFGMLLLLNGALAVAQLLLAPLVAAYFRQPEVADLLRVLAVVYLATPLIALPNALLMRDIDYRRQAKANLLSAVVGALTSLWGAYHGWGVWTLVAASLALWWSRALGMVIAAGGIVRPSFRFGGAGQLARFGGAIMITQLFWFVQSQADVFLAGRRLSAHELGIYTTSLFLAQILAAKFVPPVNEVAFAAYSRLQHDRRALAGAFVKAVRAVMLVAMPFSLGLAAVAEPLVLTMLGPKWGEVAGPVRLLALAMPFVTLQILFAPATNGLGRPAVATRVGLVGALLMPAAFWVGLHGGLLGLAASWLLAAPLFAAATAAMSLPHIGAGWGDLGRALVPGGAASLLMAAVVLGAESIVPPLAPAILLTGGVALGVLVYGGLLLLFARPLLRELYALTRGQLAPDPA